MVGNVARAQTEAVVTIHRQVLGTPRHAGYWRGVVEKPIDHTIDFIDKNILHYPAFLTIGWLNAF